ncbi:type II secretion system minor pseudopilin GspH [Dokdonella sp.]|uniref:type II secretion system minor pseudopilin GspH n=1 Tax=Dokdonella sp. TaxID=2291710 RepID=UPI003BB02F02
MRDSCCRGSLADLQQKREREHALGVPRLRCGRGALPALRQRREHKHASGASRLRCCPLPLPAIVGFTLIEILVVIVIVAVLALAVTISIATAGGERQLGREAERLQALIVHACSQAELSGREIGVRLSAGGYAFSRLGFDGWSANGQGDELRPRTWLPGMQVALFRDGSELRLAEDESQAPQIVCFSSGELSPFVLRLQLGDAARRYEVRGQADGRVEVESVDLRS